MTETELASMVGLSVNSISNLEKAHTIARPSTRQKIEAALGCRIDWTADTLLMVYVFNIYADKAPTPNKRCDLSQK